MKPLLLSTLFTLCLLAIFSAGWMFFHRPTHLPAISLASPFLFPSIALPTPAPQPVRLLFGGDLMFDRNIRLYMAEHGVDFVLAPLSQIFTDSTAVIANLEGPITSNPSLSAGSAVGSTRNFLFTFDPTIVPMLKKNHFEIVNLGNNHILNFGTAGVTSSKSFLSAGGVEFFGNTATEQNSAERVLFKNFGSHKVAFVNYNQFVEKGWQTALDDLKFAKAAADLVIVMPHWGLEYQTEANQVIQDEAHQLIDAGADLIIGSHPHVIQQSEVYQGKQIYYSLGNFVFDQYFSPETKKGLLVRLEISPDKSLHFTEIPIQLETNGQTVLAK